MNIFDFTVKGQKTLQELPKKIQNRICKKLFEMKEHPDIFSILTVLVDYRAATHRLRVGSYRVILELTLQTKIDTHFSVLEVGHRKDIYR